MIEQKQIQDQQGHYMQPAYPPYYEDEISLIDLWLVLAKRKKLIGLVFGGFVLLALALAFVKKDKFEFTTTIEIGQIISISESGEESYQLVEPIQSVKAKLENSYLPSAQATYYAANPDAGRFKISIEAPKNAQMLIIKSKGAEANSSQHKSMHTNAVTPLIIDLNRKVSSSQQKLESQLAEARQELLRLQNPVVLRLLASENDAKINQHKDLIDRLKSDIFWQPKIKQLESNITQAKINLKDTVNKSGALIEQRKRLDELENLLLKQLEGLNQQIIEARSVRMNAISSINDESGAMTLLLLDSEMQRLITRQSELEERIYIDHKNNIISLENEIKANKDKQQDQRINVHEAEAELIKTRADRDSQIKLLSPNLDVLKDKKEQALLEHERKIISQKELINNIEASIKSVTETHVIVPFLQSLTPQGLTSKVLFLIVVFLGFIFAVISAFIAEFLQKAREKMSEEGVV